MNHCILKKKRIAFLEVVYFCFKGYMGDAEYIAAFQQIVMPIAYEV